MKTLILILVVAAHLALVLVFMRRHDADSRRPAAKPDADSRVPQTEQDRATPRAERRPAFSPDTFRRTPRAVPAELAAKLEACRTGVLVDWHDKTILWEKNPADIVPIASMSKMMTALLLMESVMADATLTLDTPVRVTRTAARVGGSQMWLDPREVFSLDELLMCMMIHSANDAAFLAAEFLGGGSVEAFVQRMNEQAPRLGLSTLRFHNPHGLPETGGRENTGSALDTAILAGLLLAHPEVVAWSSTYMTRVKVDDGKLRKLAERMLVNRNRLVRDCPGVVGMKTGYTRAAGFCVAATCVRDGRTLIAVVTGSPSQEQRNDLVTALLEWGYDRPMNQ